MALTATTNRETTGESSFKSVALEAMIEPLDTAVVEDGCIESVATEMPLRSPVKVEGRKLVIDGSA